MTEQDFIPHDGRSMPLDPDALVNVKFRDGRDVLTPSAASWWHGSGGLASCWLHNEHNSNADIVAYRVVSP